MDIDHFNGLLEEVEGNAIVDFWAEWCAPCRMLTPVLERLSSEEKVALIKINVDESPELAQHFNVTGIPTVIFYQGGEPINRFTGSKSGPQVKQELFGE